MVETIWPLGPLAVTTVSNGADVLEDGGALAAVSSVVATPMPNGFIAMASPSSPQATSSSTALALLLQQHQVSLQLRARRPRLRRVALGRNLFSLHEYKMEDQ